MKIPGCPVFRERTRHMVDVVQCNALDPVMGLISADEVDTCLDVLRSTDRNTMVDDVLRVDDLDYKAILEIEESRLMPPKYAVAIRDIVMRLKPYVTAEMVALFSHGLTLIDAVLNACLRCQDLLGMFAFASYMMTFVSPKNASTEVMEVVLPLTAKNTRASDGSVQGTACVHLKRPDMHRWLAVLLVLLRPLMREHLRGSEKQLCLEVGPFDANGKLFTNSKLLDLFQYAGKHFLGLPRWGYNINRTVHTSSATFLAMAREEGVDAPWVEKVFGQARQSHERTKGTYSSTEARYSSQEGMQYAAGGILPVCDALEAATSAASAPAPGPSVAPAFTVATPTPVSSVTPALVPAVTPVTMVAPVVAPTAAEQIEMMKLQLAMKQADAETEKAKAEQLRYAGLPPAGAASDKIAEKCQSTVKNRGDASDKRGRSEKEVLKGGPEKKPKKVKRELVEPKKLALAKKMHGYMLEMRSRAVVAGAEMAKVGEKPKKGSWVCTMSKCKNTYSGSTVFAEGVVGAVGIRKELERLYPGFTKEFFETFQLKTQLQPFFNVLLREEEE